MRKRFAYLLFLTFSATSMLCGMQDDSMCQKRKADGDSSVGGKRLCISFSCANSACKEFFTRFNSQEALSEHIRQEHLKPRVYKCWYGDDRLFDNYSDWAKHIEESHKQLDDSYFCPFDGCIKTEKKLSVLLRHIQTHTGEKPFVCKFCGLDFPMKKNAERHVQTQHPECLEKQAEQFICSGCGTYFATKANLQRHVKLTYEKKKRFVCSYYGCEKRYVAKIDLEKHIKAIHKKQFDFICAECGAGFVSGKELSMHAKGVHGEYNLKCEVCGKLFKTRAVLKNHVRAVHEQERDHRCSYCEQAFYAESDLTRHIETQHPEKLDYVPESFICSREGCGKKFLTRPNLDRHIKIIHEGEMRFGCWFCEKGQKPDNLNKLYKRFTAFASAKRHVEKQHGIDPRECSIHVLDFRERMQR